MSVNDPAPDARPYSRAFTIFWIGQTFSVLGDAFALIGLPLYIFAVTGSVLKMGLVSGAYGLGQILAGLFAGALVDRFDRRRLMIACDVLRALLYAAIPLSQYGRAPQLFLINLISVLGAGLGMLFQVAYITAVANLVDRDRTTGAN